MSQNYTKLLLVAILSFCLNGYSQTNLVTNGDFENWTGNQLDDWTFTSGTALRNQTDFSNGSSSTQIYDSANNQNSTIKSLNINLEPGKTYVLRYDSKASSTSNSSSKIQAVIVNLYKNTALVSIWTPLAELNSWKTNQKTIEITGADNYTIEVLPFSNMNSTVTNVSIDNIRLFEVSELQENLADKNALIALYNNTDGPNWTNSWDITGDMNFWEGIQLNNDGRVTEISLRSNNLIGTLPSELGNLTELKKLELNRTFTISSIPNQITGSIPATIQNLKKLEVLNLSTIGLTGTIPTEIGELTALEELNLEYNDLTGQLPTSLGNLSNLEYLSILSNDISGTIPSELGQLNNLKQLRLISLDLSGTIPSELGQMTNLEVLYLSGNSLTGAIPNEIGQLQNLKQIILSLNQLSGSIPASLGQLPLLELLLIGQNNLTGSIPQSLGQLSNLTRLNLRINNLEGNIPIELGQLNQLESILLNSNVLTGNIPIQLGMLSNLNELNLTQNNLNGTIPAELGNLSNLSKLRLGTNELTGTVPLSIAQLPNLTEFDISDNRLNGTVPSFSKNDIGVFKIATNKLVFEDLLTALSNQSNAIYSPQLNIGEELNISLEEGEVFTISVSETTDVNNTYQWRKNGTAIPGATNASLTIASIADTDAGQYDCLINNTVLNALELTKNNITLTVGASDSDNDGITNNNDNCPNTPTGETVDINGCSQSQLDDDNDGVTNNNDNCANTPTGETVDNNGCSESQLDDDNDNVTNNNDTCPNTPTGETEDTNGCSESQLDDDNDGVTNNNDNCPNTPSGNTVDPQGCTVINSGQINYLQNFSFENWSGNPISPDEWTISNANSIIRNTEATDGSFSLELDLDNSLQFKTELQNLTPIQLATNTTYTYAFDYKVKRGTNVSAEIQVTKDGNSFGIRIADEFIPFNEDGNWHTFSFDFDTNSIDEEHVFKLLFRANTIITGIVQIDNIRVLGDALPDADNDGVLDSNDQCPNTPVSALAVDDLGCEVLIDNSNLLEDPSFEDWSFGGGNNLAQWGINLIPGSSWNKNEDKSDNLQYSAELTTGNNGTNTTSVFQNDIQIYKGVEYIISIDYKVLEGTFNTLELEFIDQSVFGESVEKFSINPNESGWNTFSTTYTSLENEIVNLNIRAISDQQQQRVLLDNAVIRANVTGDLDADNDGVIDANDTCPNTPTGETVNASGCSDSQLDDDNDGVTNNNDNCPNTPVGTTVDTSGCPVIGNNDADNDGVIDANDTCPNTPTGETVNASGCSDSQLDDDNDGVTNNNDNCPNTPTGETVNVSGCSDSQLDDDNDGVTNNNDNCPNTPVDTTVDTSGCPVTGNNDGDNDGVTDADDTCPNTPTGETVNANGCSDSQLDDDNDGVTNNNDICPNTPIGETVDTEGCVVNQSTEPNIPNNGIQVKVTSTSCLDSENGEISVSFTEDYAYSVQITATLLDNTFDNINSSTGLVRSDLPADTYTVCITIPDYPNFEQCFTVKVETPEDFSSGKIVVDKDLKTGKVIVSGSKNYVLFINDQERNYSFETIGNQELSFELKDGLNNILVKTDKECQGKYAESIVFNVIRAYPNPVSDNANIFGIQNTNDARILISDMNGTIVKNMRQDITNSAISISVEKLPVGVYLLRIISEEQDVQTKIIKK